MSTYYYNRVYTRPRVDEGKDNTNKWELTATGDACMLKNILTGWDNPVDAVCKPSEEAGIDATVYYTYELLGLYLKSDLGGYDFERLDKLDKREFVPKDDIDAWVILDKNLVPVIGKRKDDVHAIKEHAVEIYSELEIKRFKDNDKEPEAPYITLKEWIDKPKEEKDKYVNIYFRQEHEHNGSWYNQQGFIDYKKEIQAKLDKEIEKKYTWQHLKRDLNYLKLTQEEKEQVDSEFEYVDESIEDYENIIYACNYFINLFTWYSEDKSYDTKNDNWRGRDTLMYIYSF